MEKESRMRKERRRNQDHTRIFLIIIIACYLFFFTSNLTIPQPLTDKADITKLNTMTEYGEERSFKLLSATYDEEQHMMEIIMQLTASSVEMVNEYYYAVTLNRGNVRDIKISEPVNTQLVTVVRLEGLKPSFRELTLLLAPKEKAIEDISDDETAFITINRFNMRKDHINTSVTEKDYLRQRLETVIAEYCEAKKGYQKKLSDTEKEISALEKEIIRTKESMSYMTSEEIRLSDERITEARNEIKGLEKKVHGYKEKIREQQDLIDDSKMKLSDME